MLMILTHVVDNVVPHSAKNPRKLMKKNIELTFSLFKICKENYT